jgi:5-methyltetrahydropteroyltriglutamate--homocysteine methyltransferase
MSESAKVPFRADHVGSLLRPRELHEARAKAAKGEIDRAALAAVEDKCIRDVVKLQESIGIQSITDGEFRRDWWHIDFLRNFDGVTTTQGTFGVHFVNADEQPPLMQVRSKIRRLKPSMLDHFKFLKSVTKGTPKFCMPSGT